VEELAEVLAVDFDDAEGVAKLNSSWRWEDQEQALLSACSSLISIVCDGDGNDDSDDSDDDDHRDHGSRAVQFSHFSVKEFLISPRLATPNRDVSSYHIDLEPAHTIMAQACLGILLQSDARFEHTGTGITSPLARYAAEYWVTHAQFKKVSSNLRRAMETLFDQDKPYFAAWLESHDMDTDPPSSPFYQLTGAENPKTLAGPLYYAALCGFQDVIEHLVVKDPRQVNTNGGYYVTPFVAALSRRHFEQARLLHRNGSSVDPRGRVGFTPLISAASCGDLEMIQVLLEYKADINARRSLGYTPLLQALSHANNIREVARLLLEHGANPNIALDDGDASLHLASQSGISEVVRLLLDHGADVHAVGASGKTAVQIALEYGHDEIVTLLSAGGTDGSS
jgi:hypothetical protein